MIENLVPWFLIIPLLCSVLTLVGSLFKRAERGLCIAAIILLSGLIPVLIASAPAVFAGGELRYAMGGWAPPLGIQFILDGFAWISIALACCITLPVAVFSLGEKKYGAHFFSFLFLLVTGMLGVSLTDDLFTMFVCFEIVAISAYVLIAFDGTSAGLVASFKYLILSSVGILIFLLGIFLIYRNFGILSLTQIHSILEASGSSGPNPMIHAALVCLCVGIGVRTAFIPFHTWLPEAHAYAPHPISALLSGVLIKISLFSMIRILTLLNGDYLFQLLIWIGGFTAISAVISALAQSDAKRLLAYHSISQMGYVLAVFSVQSGISLTAAFSHAINHALFKGLLFLTVGTAVHICGERNLYKMRPLGREFPWLSAAFFIGALSISGIPPFNGYASKSLISAGMKGSPVYLLLWITSFGTIASFIKLSRIFLPPSFSGRIPDVVRDTGAGDVRPGLLSMLPVMLLSILCLVTGWFGSSMAAVVHRLLYAEPLPAMSPLFAPSKLLLFLPLPVLGIAVYRLLITRTGKAIANRQKSLMPDLNTVLLLFFVGMICFAAMG